MADAQSFEPGELIEIAGRKWYSVAGAAKVLFVTPQTVSRWRRKGTLKGKKVGLRYYFPEAALLKLLNNSNSKG